MKKLITVLIVLEMMFMMAKTAIADPFPNIKANGSDGPITITTRDTLSVTVELNPMDFNNYNADYYVLAYCEGPTAMICTPEGNWYYYIYPNQWLAGDNFNPAYRGPLFNLPAFEVLQGSRFPVGTYEFYFLIAPHGDEYYYYDFVKVDIPLTCQDRCEANWASCKLFCPPLHPSCKQRCLDEYQRCLNNCQ